MFEWIADPTIWVGLLTLVVLEIVLGIDNLIFIAILADKLPPKLRDRARLMGLGLALGMRVGLLFSISWLVTLTEPLLSVLGKALSGRDLILLLGGVFLLFKATMELHERLEGGAREQRGPQMYAGFWTVVAQIVVLDAVFSLDAVITAVGMVDELPVMIAAVVIAMAVMIVASKPLTAFVNAHPTVVILCLGFLLMIGLALIAEGAGFHIPKGYLYAAIGFSVLIESFNQLALFNRRRFLAGTRPLRERTAEAVLRLLGGRPEPAVVGAEVAAMAAPQGELPAFTSTERGMIQAVLELGERPIQAVMTPRPDIVWLDAVASPEEIRQTLERHPHNRFLVARGELDRLLGVVEARALAARLLSGGPLNLESLVTGQPLGLPEGMSALRALEKLRQHPVPVGVVVDEYGSVEGLVTTSDLLAAIAGELAYAADETPAVIERGEGSWLLDGDLDLGRLEEVLGLDTLPQDEGFHTLAGLVLAQLQHVPKPGEGFELAGYRFEVVKMDGHRIVHVNVVRTPRAEQSGSDYSFS
jgi:CBS domain containing-hemolysin-like protein